MSQVELTILMPCLNEAETLAICIRKAKAFLRASNISGEVMIADNGSTDGSTDIAITEGAIVVPVPVKGYGAALGGGIQNANGRYIIMGDADDSYDFSNLLPFVERLRDGADLVMGNRFEGGIQPGAMPFLHKYLGNPVLSWLGRLFFSIKIGDFHCGLRGFNAEKIRTLGLRTTGMEFASEMVVSSALSGFRIDEVPTTLKKDGRTRPPHLRTWRDGWRHLSFLLMYSPRWLYLYPGLVLILMGLAGAFVLFPGGTSIGNVSFDIHTFIVSSFLILIGGQAVSLAVVARRFASSHSLIPPPKKKYMDIIDAFTLERVLLVAGFFVFIGIGGLIWCISIWAHAAFGPLQYTDMLRVLILSMLSIAVGIQAALIAFLSSITEIPTR